MMKKKILVILSAVLICASLIIPSYASVFEIDGEILYEPTRLVDIANLIDDSEEAELTSLLDEISERQKMDVVFVTVNDLCGVTAREYADFFFDDNGYGMGENRDGILFFRYYKDEDNKEVYISTSGYGITVFTDAGIEYIFDEIEQYAIDGDYYSLVKKYAELCDKFITKAENGNPYDTNNLPKEKNFIKWAVTSLIVGVILALIVTLSMKSKLKTVRKQAAASDYTKQNSLMLTNSRDTYLYSHVSMTEKPKNTSGGSSGSSTHTSSSGATHGGGGRSI